MAGIRIDWNFKIFLYRTMKISRNVTSHFQRQKFDREVPDKTAIFIQAIKLTWKTGNIVYVKNSMTLRKNITYISLKVLLLVSLAIFFRTKDIITYYMVSKGVHQIFPQSRDGYRYSRVSVIGNQSYNCSIMKLRT